MDTNMVVQASDSFAKIKEYEVWNFMSIKHAKVSFDDRNIINFKGYNDSGKSTMIRALEVCLYNRYPSSQSKFIRDDESYFRVLVTFEDGIQILKDKYSNGKGLYEMYKDSQVIFSTKKDGVLTKITGVPEPIEKYLGLVAYDDIYLNSRSCFEKQLLVETKGKENYNFLNSTLKSEELSVAGTLLNNDKNKLLSEKSRYDAEYDIFSADFGRFGELSTSSVERMEGIDKNIDVTSERLSSLEQTKSTMVNLGQIPDIPAVDVVDCTQIDKMNEIRGIQSQLSQLPNIPELQFTDAVQLDSLAYIIKTRNELEELNKSNLEHELHRVDSDKIALLGAIKNRYADISDIDEQDKKLEEELKTLEEEIQKLSSEATDFNRKVLRCKNCGAVMFDDDESHAEVC